MNRKSQHFTIKVCKTYETVVTVLQSATETRAETLPKLCYDPTSAAQLHLTAAAPTTPEGHVSETPSDLQARSGRLKY